MNVRVGLLIAGGFTLLFMTGCGDADPPNLLARRLEASLDVTAKVTYETTEIQEETGNPDPPTLMITQGKWGRRVDSYANPEGNTYSGTLLELRDKQFVCNRYTGAKELTLPDGVTLTEDQLETIEEGFCLLSKDDYSSWKQRTEVAPLFYFTSSIRQVYEDYDEQFEWEIAPSRTIAGNGADCYRHTLTALRQVRESQRSASQPTIFFSRWRCVRMEPVSFSWRARSTGMSTRTISRCPIPLSSARRPHGPTSTQT